jgi:alcohol dehydrogenase
MSTIDGFVIAPWPTAHFGEGAIEKLPGLVRAIGADHVVVVTDAALAVTPVVAQVTDVLATEGLVTHVFSGVRPDPTTDDVAAGAAAAAEAAASAAAAAAAVAEAAAVAATLKASAPLVTSAVPAPHFSAAPSASPAALAAPGAGSPPAERAALSGPPSPFAGARIALVAVGGGSSIDAAKGIAIAAVNPQRGRDLDYRREFAVPGLPIVAVPTTAGTGAETNGVGVVTDPATHRKFYLGHASTMPAAAILDPALTVGLPRAVTAATGMDALTHALESYLSLRPNPWSDGIALQAIRMIAANLPRACDDGTDLEARSQMLLAAHMAGVAFGHTGLGLCHAIGHSLGGRWNIAHGVALSMLLPDVLRFNLPVRTARLADIAFALGVGDTRSGQDRNAAAAIEAVAGLTDRVGLTAGLADSGITEADFAQIAADALDDEVLANTPRPPTRADIISILRSPPGRL